MLFSAYDATLKQVFCFGFSPEENRFEDDCFFSQELSMHLNITYRAIDSFILYRKYKVSFILK